MCRLNFCQRKVFDPLYRPRLDDSVLEDEIKRLEMWKDRPHTSHPYAPGGIILQLLKCAAPRIITSILRDVKRIHACIKLRFYLKALLW